MNILILGAAGFIGTNLAIKLAQNTNDTITLVDKSKEYFNNIQKFNFKNVKIVENNLTEEVDFNLLLDNQDVIYHLVSTTVPITSNKQIANELTANVIFTANLLDSAVKNKVKKVVFISSGGTVYGKEVISPIPEDSQTNPITSYGVQKLAIEKLLYLYNYIYGIDYKIIRLANPYGPYQRPNGILGVVTTFTYKALKNEEIIVYGDGSVVRDFIYIDDAINGIVNIATKDCNEKTFNLGSGKGTSIKELLNYISISLNKNLNIVYKEGRKVDIPINYLDISRYENNFGKLKLTNISEGIKLTADFMKKTILMEE